MVRLLNWIWMTIKRNIKRPTFWMMAILLVVARIMLGYIEERHGDNIEVLVCSEDSDKGDEIIERLVAGSDYGVTYRICDDREEMEVAIIRGESPCGLVFTEELDDIDVSDDPDGEIIMYQSADSTSGFTIKEIIYPAVLHSLSGDMLGEYLNDLDMQREDSDFILERYDAILDSTAIKIFDVNTLETDNDTYNDSDEANKGTQTQDIAGDRVTTTIMTVLVAIMTLMSYIESKASNRSLYRAVGLRIRWLYSVISTVVTVAMLVLPLGVSSWLNI